MLLQLGGISLGSGVSPKSKSFPEGVWGIGRSKAEIKIGCSLIALSPGNYVLFWVLVFLAQKEAEMQYLLAGSKLVLR